ncbi:MAG: sulfite exporter TauE/SafE family protein [Trueperaceae bacterium]|jgi:uncharacterized membrane protein YfcA
MSTSVRTLFIGIIGGFFGSLVGLGGAVVIIPLLTGWARVTQHKAHVTSLVAVVFTGIVGAISYARGGAVDLPLALAVAAAATVSAIVSATFSEKVPALVLRRIFGGLIVITSLVLLFGIDFPGSGIHGTARYAAGIGLGLMSGVLTGLLGIGGGAFVVPILVLGFGLDQHLAQGTSLAVMIPAGIAGTLVHWRAGRLDFSLIWGLVAGVVIGAFMGGQFALVLPERPLQIIFGVILIWMGLRYLGVKFGEPPAKTGEST